MKNRYNNSKLAAIDTSSQLWKDLMSGKQFKISVSKKQITRTEVDATGCEAHNSYFPNITGVASFKQRVALLSSMNYSSQIVPNLRLKKSSKKSQININISNAQKPPLSSKVSTLARFNLTPANMQNKTDSKYNFKTSKNSRNITDRKPIYISTNKSLGMLNLKDENRRYKHIIDDDNKSNNASSLERESNNIKHFLNSSNIIKDKILKNRLTMKNTLPRNSILNANGSPANSKDKISSIYSPVSNHTKSPSLPVLSSKIYKFKARNIKANDKTIGDANLIRQQKEKDLNENNILVFDMATKGETGFAIHKSVSPSINDLISQSFSPYIPKMEHQPDKYYSRKDSIDVSDDVCIESTISDTDYEKLNGEPYVKIDDYSPVKTKELLNIHLSIEKDSITRTQRASLKEISTPVKKINK